MLTAQQIALWSDKLRDISAWGLHFSNSTHDKERYRAIQDIAMAILAAATNESVDALEPLRDIVFSRPTPLVGGDAAIMNDAGAMLLVRRRDNGMWAMPGGALEVGETPAEGVVREAYEETGVRCQPLTLVGVFDSRRCGSTNRYHLYHFVFVCKPIGTVRFSEASHAHESIEVKWFTEDNLPDDIDPGHASRIPEAFRVWRSNCPAFFDQ